MSLIQPSSLSKAPTGLRDPSVHEPVLLVLDGVGFLCGRRASVRRGGAACTHALAQHGSAQAVAGAQAVVRAQAVAGAQAACARCPPPACGPWPRSWRCGGPASPSSSRSAACPPSASACARGRATGSGTCACCRACCRGVQRGVQRGAAASALVRRPTSDPRGGPRTLSCAARAIGGPPPPPPSA